jgi:hypothetical protein
MEPAGPKRSEHSGAEARDKPSIQANGVCGRWVPVMSLRRRSPLAWLYASLCALLGVAAVRTQFQISNGWLVTFFDDYLFNATQIGFALVVVWRAIVVR